MQNRTSNQVTELQNLAEIQFSRANRLGDELNKIRKDNKEMRRKVCVLTQIHQLIHLDLLLPWFFMA